MKKLSVWLLAALLVVALPLAVLAQTTEPVKIFGMEVDPAVVAGLFTFVGGGIVTSLTQLLKGWLKVQGTLAVVVCGLVAVAATAVFFLLISPPFVLGKFIVYAVVIFGEATGYYHFYGPAVAKP